MTAASKEFVWYSNFEKYLSTTKELFLGKVSIVKKNFVLIFDDHCGILPDMKIWSESLIFILSLSPFNWTLFVGNVWWCKVILRKCCVLFVDLHGKLVWKHDTDSFHYDICYGDFKSWFKVFYFPVILIRRGILHELSYSYSDFFPISLSTSCKWSCLHNRLELPSVPDLRSCTGRAYRLWVLCMICVLVARTWTHILHYKHIFTC